MWGPRCKGRVDKWCEQNRHNLCGNYPLLTAKPAQSHVGRVAVSPCQGRLSAGVASDVAASVGGADADGQAGLDTTVLLGARGTSVAGFRV
jgi:hypothetical protein